MKSVNVAKLKNSLSRYLSLAGRGERIVVTDRNVPVAEIRGIADAVGGDERLVRWEAEGLVSRGDPMLLKHFRGPAVGGSSGALDALLAERESGR